MIQPSNVKQITGSQVPCTQRSAMVLSTGLVHLVDWCFSGIFGDRDALRNNCNSDIRIRKNLQNIYFDFETLTSE